MSTDALIDLAREAERRGDLERALDGFERALLGLRERNGDAAGLAADLFRWIGRVRRQRDELELAAEACEASLAVAEAIGDRVRVADALNSLGILEQSMGMLGSARENYEKARVLADETGDHSLGAMLDQNLATLANIRGDVEEALEKYTSSLARLLDLGEEESAAIALNNMGMAHVDLGDWAAAADCFDRAYEMADRLRDSSILALVDMNRAELYLRQGRLVYAREACDRAFETYGRIGSDSGRGEAFKLYGIIARQGGKPFQSATHFTAARELARSCVDRLLEAEVEAERALLYLEQEENPEALRSLNRAHHLFTELQARRELFDLDRRLDGLEATYLEVVTRWGASIEAKDEYTAGHCERVADYACMLAEAVGFAGRDLVWFRMGGFLHDVGKIEVPAEILNKPGRLSDEEWVLMRRHTVAGDGIVRDLNFPWEIAPLVRSHHERWDGTGYPDGLSGDAIPLTARILGIADVYDALTTARSYRPALSHAEAMAIMTRDRARAFDPELFDLFTALVEKRRSAPAPYRRPVRRAQATTVAG